MRALIERLAGLPFAAVPEEFRRTIYCQRWVHLHGETGDDLWVTPLGWLHLPQLAPEAWFAGARYVRAGRRLPHSTGTVYRVPLAGLAAVVRFSRVALDPLLHGAEAVGITRQDADQAEFLGPFEEVAMVLELRQGWWGPPALRIPAAWPLAVYSPAERYPAWRLGRSESRWQRQIAALAADQAFLPHDERTGMEPDRDYLTLHRWIDGEDAVHCLGQGQLAAGEVESELVRVAGELALKGFRVLDLKAHHLILRPGRDGRLRRRRDGRLLHGLIDFELLERLPAYCQAISRGEVNNPPPRPA